MKITNVVHVRKCWYLVTKYKKWWNLKVLWKNKKKRIQPTLIIPTPLSIQWDIQIVLTSQQVTLTIKHMQLKALWCPICSICDKWRTFHPKSQLNSRAAMCVHLKSLFNAFHACTHHQEVKPTPFSQSLIYCPTIFKWSEQSIKKILQCWLTIKTPY